jgi:hypothetical protein
VIPINIRNVTNEIDGFFSLGKSIAGNASRKVEQAIRGALPHASITVSSCKAILLPLAGAAAPACKPVRALQGQGE